MHRHLVPKLEKCVQDCQDHWYGENKKCIACHEECKTCDGVLDTKCLSCIDPFAFNPNLHTCKNNCDKG